MMRKTFPSKLIEKTNFPRTKYENPLTRGKEKGKTGEKPIYLLGIERGQRKQEEERVENLDNQ